jgi:hypothetical protein
LFTEPLRVGAGLVATEFALERENLGGLLPSETKKQFKKVLDLKSGIHSSYEPCSAVSAGLNLTALLRLGSSAARNSIDEPLRSGRVH